MLRTAGQHVNKVLSRSNEHCATTSTSPRPAVNSPQSHQDHPLPRFGTCFVQILQVLYDKD